VVVPAGLALTNIALATIVVAILFLARDVVVPIVLALFLTFVLAPLVGLLQRWHFPRAMAVLSSVTVAFALVFVLSTMVVTQLRQLSNDLPGYQTTLGEKFHALRETVVGSGLMKGSTILKDMTKALDVPDQSKPPSAVPLTEPGNPRKPVPVEVHQPEPGASDTLVTLLRPLVTPITTTAIIIVFVLFFLFQREDLRNRFIRLAGTRDLERTTTALDDAGQRLARFFLTQLIVNGAFGIVIGAGLALIGVPSAPLWGLLAAILRFVPYLGAPLSAVLPLTLAAAVGPDWTMALWTAALFVVVEVVTGQMVEPVVYGQSAGLSPVAIVVAAAFWAWLWGPLGLLISTPLTLCLVVMARHVDGMQFIDIMLGDQAALTPQQATYQRMLAGDPVETIEHAHSLLKEGSILEYYQEILLGALSLAQQDAEQGRLDEKRLDNILKTVTEVVEDLGDRDGGSAPKTKPPDEVAAGQQDGDVVRLRSQDPTVVCLPGFGKLDEAAAVVVTDALKREGIGARALSRDAAPSGEADSPAILCICFLENLSEARMRYTMRRLFGSEAPKAVVLALFGANSQNASNAEVKSGQSFKAAYTLQTTVTDILAASTRDQGASVQAPVDVGAGSENGNPATARS
jgi:predicted PurR-regulated permease PerM